MGVGVGVEVNVVGGGVYVEVGIDVVGVEVEPGPPVEVLGEAVTALVTTMISPRSSEDTRIRPFGSNAIPTGLKHRLGHCERFGALTMLVKPFWLLAAATGWPFEKGMCAKL